MIHLLRIYSYGSVACQQPERESRSMNYRRLLDFNDRNDPHQQQQQRQRQQQQQQQQKLQRRQQQQRQQQSSTLCLILVLNFAKIVFLMIAMTRSAAN